MPPSTNVPAPALINVPVPVNACGIVMLLVSELTVTAPAKVAVVRFCIQFVLDAPAANVNAPEAVPRFNTLVPPPPEIAAPVVVIVKTPQFRFNVPIAGPELVFDAKRIAVPLFVEVIALLASKFPIVNVPVPNDEPAPVLLPTNTTFPPPTMSK